MTKISTNWTENRKELCNTFWDDCAQKSCIKPCSKILEAEKKSEIKTD
jgi:hypothetical protein